MISCFWFLIKRGFYYLPHQQIHCGTRKTALFLLLLHCGWWWLSEHWKNKPKKAVRTPARSLCLLSTAAV